MISPYQETRRRGRSLVHIDSPIHEPGAASDREDNHILGIYRHGFYYHGLGSQADVGRYVFMPLLALWSVVHAV